MHVSCYSCVEEDRSKLVSQFVRSFKSLINICLHLLTFKFIIVLLLLKNKQKMNSKNGKKELANKSKEDNERGKKRRFTPYTVTKGQKEEGIEKRKKNEEREEEGTIKAMTRVTDILETRYMLCNSGYKCVSVGLEPENNFIPRVRIMRNSGVGLSLNFEEWEELLEHADRISNYFHDDNDEDVKTG